MDARLDLILGPMFSGKTTELIRRCVMYTKAGFSVVYINSALDTRGDLFSTHNSSLSTSQNLNMIKTNRLMDTYPICKSNMVIAVDEAHFFDDIVEFYKQVVEVDKKILVVSGLNGTSAQEQFGRLHDLIPFCDNISFICSFCTECSKMGIIKNAPFSKRIVDNTETCCIGGSDMYIAVCREHII